MEIASKVSNQAHARVLSHYGALLKVRLILFIFVNLKQIIKFFQDQGDHNRSISYLTSAISLDSSDCGYHINLGHSYEDRRLPGDIKVILFYFIYVNYFIHDIISL